jgi:uncharacterized membrane protein
MQKRFASVIAIGRKIGLNDENGYVVAIFIALLIVSATVIGYYTFLAPPAESYNTFYLLDANKKAVDYPEVLVANQNSTFNVYVNVVNHMGGKENQNYRVNGTITPDLSGTKVPEYDFSLRNDETWQDSVSITLNQVGSYSISFDLWQTNKEGKLESTHNSCVLNISVIR